MNYFVTELGFEGNVPEDYTNLRAAETWIKYLDAYHLNIFKVLESNQSYDGTCWLIIPKGLKAVEMLMQHYQNLIPILKTKFDKVYCIQEGETTFWNHYTVSIQLWIYLQFQESDKIYTQNTYDLKYFKGLFPDKPLGILRSVMDTTNIDVNNFKPKQDKVILPGPYTIEYHGFTQTIISHHTGCSIDIPPMGEGRMPKDSWKMADNVGVNYLDYMMWKEWIENLSQYKYAYFLVPVIGAGTFPLNCAYHGIPCIGDVRAETQSILYPELCVDYLDLETALSLTKKLSTDKEFYNHTSNYAKEMIGIHFTKEKFLQTINETY